MILTARLARQAHASDENILPKRAGVELIAQNEKRFNDTGALVRCVDANGRRRYG